VVEDKFMGQGLIKYFKREVEEVENIMIRKFLSSFYLLVNLISISQNLIIILKFNLLGKDIFVFLNVRTVEKIPDYEKFEYQILSP
jgi:hypothetical protein